MPPLTIVALLLSSAVSAQLPPPNLVENGAARSGDASWGRYKTHGPITGPEAKNATVEEWDGAPCFVMRNGTAWQQRIRMIDDVGGKYVLIIARGSFRSSSPMRHTISPRRAL